MTSPPFLPLLFADFSASSKVPIVKQERNYSSGSSYISKLEKKILESTVVKKEIQQKGSSEEKLGILSVYLFHFK